MIDSQIFNDSRWRSERKNTSCFSVRSVRGTRTLTNPTRYPAKRKSVPPMPTYSIATQSHRLTMSAALHAAELAQLAARPMGGPICIRNYLSYKRKASATVRSLLNELRKKSGTVGNDLCTFRTD